MTFLIDSKPELWLGGLQLDRLREYLLSADKWNHLFLGGDRSRLHHLPVYGRETTLEDALEVLGIQVVDLDRIYTQLSDSSCWQCDDCGVWCGHWKNTSHYVQCGPHCEFMDN